MLDQKVQVKIAEDAERASIKVPTSLSMGFCDGYIAGAEKEAERAAGLVEALESIQKTVLISHEMQGNNPTANICRNTAMEALTKYNNSK